MFYRILLTPSQLPTVYLQHDTATVATKTASVALGSDVKSHTGQAVL